MTSLSFVLLLVLASLVQLSSSAIPCKINLTLHSQTAKKFRVDLTVPSLVMKADNMIFNAKDERKKIEVAGKDCDTKKWLVQSFKPAANDQWEQVGNISAKFFGTGSIRIIFSDDLKPQLKDLNGVWFTEGM